MYRARHRSRAVQRRDLGSIPQTCAGGKELLDHQVSMQEFLDTLCVSPGGCVVRSDQRTTSPRRTALPAGRWSGPPARVAPPRCPAKDYAADVPLHQAQEPVHAPALCRLARLGAQISGNQLSGHLVPGRIPVSEFVGIHVAPIVNTTVRKFAPRAVDSSCNATMSRSEMAHASRHRASSGSRNTFSSNPGSEIPDAEGSALSNATASGASSCSRYPPARALRNS